MSSFEWKMQAYAKKLEADTKRKSSGLSPFIREVRARLNANMDARTIIEGESGIGKSYTALRFGELLDPRFVNDPEGAVAEQVIFSAQEYLSAVTRLPPLSVLIYDEPGQSFHHREFMSEANIILSKTMIGYRFKKFISFLCIPGLGLIDKDGKMLVSFLVNVVGHGKAEVFKQIPQKFGGEPWWKCIVDKYSVSLPSVKLRHAYEKKKQIVQDALYAKYANTLIDKDRPKLTNTDILEKILSDPALKAELTREGRLSVASIQGEFDIGRDRARGIRDKAERKIAEDANPAA